MQTAQKLSLYDQLMGLPEGLTGEILNGQLYTQPRPAGPHALVESSLEYELFGPFHKGRGGPGGWWIIIEPEVHFIRDTEVLVPDVAGWRRQRMPDIPRDHRFEVVPDWVCEILSPSTAGKDREIKLPIYAHYGVQYVWLVDPLARTLEALGLQDGKWVQLGSFRDDDRVSIAPFAEISIALPDLWC
jgi:Uma2 family endonuclease